MGLAGYPARIFQHEFDHLHGVMYLDRIESPLDIFASVELQRQGEEFDEDEFETFEAAGGATGGHEPGPIEQEDLAVWGARLFA